MAYTPKTWQCGDTITAEDLNHIEQGVANAGGGSALLAVNISYDEQGRGRLDKTWQEIYDAFPNAYLTMGEIKGAIQTVGSMDNQYGIESNSDMFIANAPDDYPQSSGRE